MFFDSRGSFMGMSEPKLRLGWIPLPLRSRLSVPRTDTPNAYICNSVVGPELQCDQKR